MAEIRKDQPLEDDTEGHKFSKPHADEVAPDTDDTEGHRMSKPHADAGEDDTEGHRMSKPH